jgi:hypothetical protein
VRALRTALSLEELEVLKASVGEDGTVTIPSEWRSRVEVAQRAAARELTWLGQPATTPAAAEEPCGSRAVDGPSASGKAF